MLDIENSLKGPEQPEKISSLLEDTPKSASEVVSEITLNITPEAIAGFEDTFSNSMSTLEFAGDDCYSSYDNFIRAYYNTYIDPSIPEETSTYLKNHDAFSTPAKYQEKMSLEKLNEEKNNLKKVLEEKKDNSLIISMAADFYTELYKNATRISSKNALLKKNIDTIITPHSEGNTPSIEIPSSLLSHVKNLIDAEKNYLIQYHTFFESMRIALAGLGLDEATVKKIDELLQTQKIPVQ